MPLAGCAGHFREWVNNGLKVGPEYMRPAAQVADDYIDVNAPGVVSDEADHSQWWTVFNDPYLDNLVQMAYQQGLAGAFWFTVPNVLAVLLFVWLGPRIREKLPHGYSLP